MVSIFLVLTIFLATTSAILGQNNGTTTHIVLSNTTIVCPSIDIDAVHRDNIELKEIIVQMWSSFTARLDALEARLSCVSNCSLSEVTNSTMIPPIPGLEEEIYQNLTVRNNWYLLYDQPYSHYTTSAELLNVTYSCPNRVLVGARRNATDPQLALAAVGPVQVLQHTTVLNKPVKFGNVYWYRTSPNSFGFSPNEIINQNIADYQTAPPELRLSWHLDVANGGYRAGSTILLDQNSIWRKVIYCLN